VKALVATGRDRAENDDELPAAMSKKLPTTTS
jgi:hypothetical protein